MPQTERVERGQLRRRTGVETPRPNRRHPPCPEHEELILIAVTLGFAVVVTLWVLLLGADAQAGAEARNRHRHGRQRRAYAEEPVGRTSGTPETTGGEHLRTPSGRPRRAHARVSVQRREARCTAKRKRVRRRVHAALSQREPGVKRTPKTTAWSRSANRIPQPNGVGQRIPPAQPPEQPRPETKATDQPVGDEGSPGPRDRGLADGKPKRSGPPKSVRGTRRVQRRNDAEPGRRLRRRPIQRFLHDVVELVRRNLQELGLSCQRPTKRIGPQVNIQGTD